IDAAGVWSYTLDNTNATVQALNTSSTPLTDTITVTTADGTTHDIVITINEIGRASCRERVYIGAVTEAGKSTGNPNAGGTLIVAYVGRSNAVTACNSISAVYAHDTIDAAGVWSYTLDNTNATVQALNTSSTPLTDTITVTTADGTTHDIVITIN